MAFYSDFVVQIHGACCSRWRKVVVGSTSLDPLCTVNVFIFHLMSKGLAGA